uniref:Zinc finger protein 638 n=1 Tax=Malurus cyaneus samueli TaxID=2593467 RepID=A0A8C5U0R6_9PASS
MFSPRGTLPPRPRGPNPSGTKPPGAFGPGGAAGPPRKPSPATPQGAPQRFSGQDALQWTGSQRINVRVTLHRADPRKVKEKSNLHQEPKGDPRANRWDNGPCPAGTSGPKPPGPAPVLEQNSNPQNRYTPESASSILASFGLSNEDLEELSRYPDDQLTPENMPRILREIRIRKLGHAVPGLHAPSRGEEPGGDSSGTTTAVKSKVIDYGHASKYGYTEDPLEIPRVYNPEPSNAENREEFQREQSVPVAVPPPSVSCNPVFPAEDLIKLPTFPSDSSPAPSVFPAEPPAKVPGLCGTTTMIPIDARWSSRPCPSTCCRLTRPSRRALWPSASTSASSARPQLPATPALRGTEPFQSQADEPIKSPFGVVKASWLPVFPDSQKSKRLPTPSMMNDYYATSPRIFPHLCSLCNIECTHMKVSGFKPRLFPKIVYSVPFAGVLFPGQIVFLGILWIWDAGLGNYFFPCFLQLLREDLLSCGTVLQISDLPDDGFSDQDIKKIVQPFGKVSDLIVLQAWGAAANPLGEPRAAKKGPVPTPNVPEEIPEGQPEIPESHLGGAARELPRGMDKEGVDSGIGVPVAPAGEETHPEPEFAAEKEIKKEDEELSSPAMEPVESSSKAEGEPAAIPGVSPGAASLRSDEASVDPASPGVTQPSTETDTPEKTPVPEAGKNSQEPSTERKTIPKTTEAPGKKWDADEAEREAKTEESVPKAAGENPGKSLVKAGVEPEKPPGKSSPKSGAAVENSGNAVGDGHTGSLVKSHQNKGTGAAKPDESCPAAPLNPTASLKESCLGKTLLKAVVSVPDILKQRIPVRISEPSLGKAGEQKIPPKPEPRGQAGAEKKIPSKATAQPGSESSQGRGNGNSGSDGQGDGGKGSSQQEKDSQGESRAGSKQCQEGESGTSSTKEDPGGNLSPGNDVSILFRSQEEELFPFNLDEFVTVDEVVEEAESPVSTRRNPPRGKRKEGPKATPSEPAPKRRKGKSSGASAAEGELSFVTLDEIGEEEDAPVPLPGVDPQGLVVVDEVAEEEELSEAVKDPQALLTLDEISEQEEPGSQRDGPRAEFEERDLKAEPLVTVDEIGEVEELPLNEPAELSAEEGKGNPGDCAASQVPDDPNALVTVDEIQEDNEDNPLVTLDEVNEDEDDFLADFNHLKEELNFVTVDEVGDEEEENAFPGKNLPEDEDDEDIVAVAGPEEMGILGVTSPEEEMAEISKPKGEEPQGKSTPKALDILVPKAGFFCQICSLFYADEPSMINHCRTPLHRQNMEKELGKDLEPQEQLRELEEGLSLEKRGSAGTF